MECCSPAAHRPGIALSVLPRPRAAVTAASRACGDSLSRSRRTALRNCNGQPLIVEIGRRQRHHRRRRRGLKPDGCSLFLAGLGPIPSRACSAKSPRPAYRLPPIMHAANLPAVVLIRPTLPHKTLPEFIAAAKREPGRSTRLGGDGNWTHLLHSLSRQPG
jgi:hypothetical protein